MKAGGTRSAKHRAAVGLRRALIGATAAAVAACGTGDPASGPATQHIAPTASQASVSPPDPPPPSLAPHPAPTDDPATTGPPGPDVQRRPDWLGTRVLPVRPDGLGEVRPTPPELVDRRLPPPDPRPAPAEFGGTVEPVPDDVLARSTWTDDCPVPVDELRYLTVTFWGFDDQPHLGEMIVHESVANDVVAVFGQLYSARFPIEEMRVVDTPELDAPPTGDGNNTTAFVCRATTGGSNWSQHAYGLAVDVNPFHNPYHRDDAVLPELASAYLDRTRDVPGMIKAGDAVTEAFTSIGWGWGGTWKSLKDWMHFSRSGR